MTQPVHLLRMERLNGTPVHIRETPHQSIAAGFEPPERWHGGIWRGGEKKKIQHEMRNDLESSHRERVEAAHLWMELSSLVKHR